MQLISMVAPHNTSLLGFACNLVHQSCQQALSLPRHYHEPQSTTTKAQWNSRSTHWPREPNCRPGMLVHSASADLNT